MNEVNIMIVGVGGQGTLLASRIIGNVAINSSYDVKLSEIHGMAQRGGSVVSSIKMAEKVYSPIIEKGEADIILAFEELEALRWLDRKSTRLNSSHVRTSYAVFCLKKKTTAPTSCLATPRRGTRST